MVEYVFLESACADIAERAKKIKLILTDCDGVLTDAGVFYGSEGEVLKRFNIRDGMAVERLAAKGIETGIITGELSPSVKKRAEKLKIQELHLGIKDKLACLREICQRKKLSFEEVAYIGDDVNDLEVLRAVGLSAAPRDAFELVRRQVHVLCRSEGGRGAFRDFAEQVLTFKE